jgi:hypothetical protein
MVGPGRLGGMYFGRTVKLKRGEGFHRPGHVQELRVRVGVHPQVDGRMPHRDLCGLRGYARLA